MAMAPGTRSVRPARVRRGGAFHPDGRDAGTRRCRLRHRRRLRRRACAAMPRAASGNKHPFHRCEHARTLQRRQLACMVNERRPDVVVTFTSGAMKFQKSDLPEGSQFVPKPYRGKHAVRLIEELVGAASGLSPASLWQISCSNGNWHLLGWAVSGSRPDR